MINEINRANMLTQLESYSIKAIAHQMDYLAKKINEIIEAVNKENSELVCEQIKWERDTAIEQLHSIGKELGEDMNDTTKVVLCENCRHRCFFDGVTTCNKDYGIHDGSWYCADGERKER